MKSNKVWMIRLTGGNRGGGGEGVSVWRASDTLAYTEHKYDQESVLTRQCKARTNIRTHVQLSCFGIKMSNIRPALPLVSTIRHNHYHIVLS